MKKVGFCINSLEMGGAEKLLVDMIKLLYLTKRYEIYLLTKNESNSYFYNEIKDKIKYFYLITKEEESRYKNYSFIGRLILSFFKRKNFNKFNENVDILIDFLDGDFYKYMKLERKKKKILWLHSEFQYLKAKKKILDKLKYYSSIIVITDAMKKVMKQNKLKIRIEQVFNFIDFNDIDQKLSKNFKLKEEKYFLTVCRLNEEQKDVTTLIKTFSKYKGERKLCIIGDGRSRSELEELTKKLNLDGKIRFLGMKENPYIYMKNSDGFILSSKGEGFGLVIVEALYCGAKVIASDCDFGPREILFNGEIGELFEIGNEKQLLEKLNNIDEYTYSRERVNDSLKRFEKEEILKKIERILNDK